jgi:uncharacterized membrane protein
MTIPDNNVSENQAAGGKPPAVSYVGGANPFTRVDEPVWSITLWPYRSLSPQGFRIILGVTAVGLALPILALAGTGAALALAPFAVLALFALWGFIKLSYRSGRVTEVLRLWPDAIAVERREAWGRVRRWDANPYWVDVELSDTKAVERYLTLRGNGRTIELGAFLTPDERVDLADELRTRIAHLQRAI